MSKGVITAAYGSQRYLNMARALALTLAAYAPEYKRAIVTDAPEVFEDVYDIVVPRRGEYGSGLRQKLYINHYSPFEMTLFIDSDCLLVRPISEVFDLFSGSYFGVNGRQYARTHWFETEDLPESLRFDSYPMFNGGLYYFTSDSRTEALLSTARDIFDHYDEYNIKRLRGGPNEEPTISIAMAAKNVSALEDKGRSMYTPIGSQRKVRVDVIRGISDFDKYGEAVSPAIVHFCAEFGEGPLYRRESKKAELLSLPAPLRAAMGKAVDLRHADSPLDDGSLSPLQAVKSRVRGAGRRVKGLLRRPSKV